MRRCYAHRSRYDYRELCRGPKGNCGQKLAKSDLSVVAESDICLGHEFCLNICYELWCRLHHPKLELLDYRFVEEASINTVNLDYVVQFLNDASLVTSECTGSGCVLPIRELQLDESSQSIGGFCLDCTCYEHLQAKSLIPDVFVDWLYSHKVDARTCQLRLSTTALRNVPHSGEFENNVLLVSECESCS